VRTSALIQYHKHHNQQSATPRPKSTPIISKTFESHIPANQTHPQTHTHTRTTNSPHNPNPHTVRPRHGPTGLAERPKTKPDAATTVQRVGFVDGIPGNSQRRVADEDEDEDGDVVCAVDEGVGRWTMTEVVFGRLGDYRVSLFLSVWPLSVFENLHSSHHQCCSQLEDQSIPSR